jgi:hypothetical protein
LEGAEKQLADGASSTWAERGSIADLDDAQPEPVHALVAGLAKTPSFGNLSLSDANLAGHP